MKWLVVASIVVVFRVVAPEAAAFHYSYECTAVAETSIGYDPYSDTIEYAGGKTERPTTVRLAGVTGDTPTLHGAGTPVPLAVMVRTQTVIWFAEKAPPDRVVNWTLFEQNGSRPVTLINTRSYSLLGAASATVFYQCR